MEGKENEWKVKENEMQMDLKKSMRWVYKEKWKKERKEKESEESNDLVGNGKKSEEWKKKS